MHTIAFDPQRALVDACFTGEVSATERGRAAEEVAIAAAVARSSKILVDFRSARFSADDLAAARDLVRQVVHNETLRHCQIAYVTCRDVMAEPVTDILAGKQCFAAERFHSRDDALDWLGEGRPSHRTNAIR